MSNKLIGIISSEGTLKGVIEEDNFDVKVQIIGSGPRGLPGSDGYTPIKGIDYFDGKDGAKGETGERGAQGIKGDTGDKGDQGIQGERGLDGKAFVYDDFTPEQLANLKGEKGEQGIPGKDGEQGLQGTPGKDGVNATTTNIASEAEDGLMSKEDKVKLNRFGSSVGFDLSKAETATDESNTIRFYKLEDMILCNVISESGIVPRQTYTIPENFAPINEDAVIPLSGIGFGMKTEITMSGNSLMGVAPQGTIFAYFLFP